MSKKKRRDIPLFQTPIIETHCHLDYLDPAALTQTLQTAQEVGIERIVTIAVSPDNLDRVMTLTNESEVIWGTQGIHPHDAEAYTNAIDKTIRERVSNERIIAVGEIGLDYYYDHADRSAQRSAFERQLQIAVEHHMPVVIHTREADDDTRDILRNFSADLACKGVIHSFTSSLELAHFCLDEGFSLGFNGITTFNSADNVRVVVAATPPERILLETDSPYLTPVPYRSRPNAPYYLPFIAEQIAEIKGMDVEDLLVQAYQNSIKLLFNEDSALSVGT